MLSKFGKPILTATDSSNPWWSLLEEAVRKANGKLGKPEIFPASTDARYFRELGLPAIGFSPMANTPLLLHDHNEVSICQNFLLITLLICACLRDSVCISETLVQNWDLMLEICLTW